MIASGVVEVMRQPPASWPTAASSGLRKLRLELALFGHVERVNVDALGRASASSEPEI